MQVGAQGKIYGGGNKKVSLWTPGLNGSFACDTSRLHSLNKPSLSSWHQWNPLVLFSQNMVHRAHPLAFTDRNPIHQGQEFQQDRGYFSGNSWFSRRLAPNLQLVVQSVDEGDNMSFIRQFFFFQGQGKTKNNAWPSVRSGGALP